MDTFLDSVKARQRVAAGDADDPVVSEIPKAPRNAAIAPRAEEAAPLAPMEYLRKYDLVPKTEEVQPRTPMEYLKKYDLLPPVASGATSESPSVEAPINKPLEYVKKYFSEEYKASLVSAPVAKPVEETGVMDEIGRSLSHGFQVTVPKAVGQAAEFFGAHELGSSMVKNAMARETADNKESAYGQTLKSPWSVRGNIYEAGDSAALSVAPGAAGAAIGAGIGLMFGGLGAGPGALIGYGLGSLASLPIFYGSQGQESYEKVKKAQIDNGVSPEAAESEARTAGHLSGSIEAGGELIADVIPFAKMFKPLASITTKAAGTLVKDMFVPTLKEAGKTVAKTVAGEIITEMGQTAGEASVEGAYGAGPGATWEDTRRVIMPTLLMSLIPGMAGAASKHAQVNAAREALESKDTSVEARTKIALGAVKEMSEVSEETARNFSVYVGRQIASGLPIVIGDDASYAPGATAANPASNPAAPENTADTDALRTRLDDAASMRAKIFIETDYKNNPQDVIDVMSALHFSTDQNDTELLQNLDRISARLGFIDNFNAAKGDGVKQTESQKRGDQILSDNPYLRNDFIAAANDYGNLVPPMGGTKFDKRNAPSDQQNPADSRVTEIDSMWDHTGDEDQQGAPPPPPPPATVFNAQAYIANSLTEWNAREKKGSVQDIDVAVTDVPPGLKGIAAVFGIDLYGFKTSKSSIKGFSDPSSNRIFINTGALNKLNGLFLLGHETWHQFESRHPEFTKELSTTVTGFLNDNYDSYSTKLQAHGYRPGEVDSEITGDVMGLVFNDKKFWVQLGVYNPSLFEKTRDIVTGLIQKIQDFISAGAENKFNRAQHLKSYLSDYKTVRDLMAQATGDLSRMKPAPQHSHGNPYDEEQQGAPPPQWNARDARIAVRQSLSDYLSRSTAPRFMADNTDQTPNSPNEPKVPGVRLVGGAFVNKDNVKSLQATKFIGRGSLFSSTNNYRKQWGARANTGIYSNNDVVFISAEGIRRGRKSPDFLEIDKALFAGARILTDSMTTGRERDYNIGEKEVAAHLLSQGAIEQEPGVWVNGKNDEHRKSLTFDQKLDLVRALLRDGEIPKAVKLFREEKIYELSDKKLSFDALMKEDQAPGWVANKPRFDERTRYDKAAPVDTTSKLESTRTKRQKALGILPRDSSNRPMTTEEADEADFTGERYIRIGATRPKFEKQVSEPMSSVKETKKGRSLRQIFDQTIKNLTKSNFYDETLTLLQEEIKKTDDQLAKLNRISVENQDGTTTDFYLKSEEDENAGMWAVSDLNAYSRNPEGIVYDKPTTKLEVLAHRRQLTNELEKAREQSSAGKAWRVRLSAARIAQSLAFFAKTAILGGANREEVSALYNEYMASLYIDSSYAQSIKADKLAEFEALKKEQIEERNKAVEEAAVPDDQQVIAKLLADVRSNKMTAQGAIDFIERASQTGEMQKESAARDILIGLVGDAKLNAARKQAILQQVDSFASAFARNGLLRLDSFFDIFGMNGVDVPAGARLHSRIAVRQSLSDYLSSHGNTYTAQEHWMRSMQSVIQADPEQGKTRLSTLFSTKEIAEYKDWIKQQQAIAKRRMQSRTDSNDVRDVFPNLLFVKHTLNSMRDVSQLSESDRLALTRFNTVTSLPDRFFSDIAFAINQRPDLSNDILKHLLGADEKLAFKNWIDERERQVDLEVQLTSRIPFIRQLMNMAFLSDKQVYGTKVVDPESGKTSVESSGILERVLRADIKMIPEIMANANALNEIAMSPENVQVDPETGEIMPKSQESIDQLLADQLDNLVANGMMRPGGKYGTGAKIFEPDSGYGQTAIDAANIQAQVPGQSNTMSIEDMERAGESRGIEEDSILDQLNAGEDVLNDVPDVREDEVDDSERLRTGVFNGKLTNELVQTYVAQITSKWKNAPQIIVLASHMQLPAALRDKVTQKLTEGMGAKGLYDGATGTVYLFSNYLTGQADTQFTLFHEVYGHLGTRAFMGAEFDTWLENMYRSNAQVRSAADALIAGGGIGKLEAIDEVLADFLGKDIEVSATKEWVGKIIAGLRKIGLGHIADFLGKMTNAELSYSLLMAKQTAQNGGYYSPLKNAPSDIRLAEGRLPYEVFAIKGINTKGYARYNPLADEWYLFTATGKDVRSASQGKTIQNYDDLIQEMQTLGKLERRMRSGFFRDNKIAPDFVRFEQSRELTGIRGFFEAMRQQYQNQYRPVFRVVEQMMKMGRIDDRMDLRKDLRLYERQTAVHVEDGNNKFITPIYQLLSAAKKVGGSFDFETTTLEGMLNKFLLAQTAAERNKQVNKRSPEFFSGSGMTDEVAKEVLDFVKAQPYSKQFNEIGSLLDQMSLYKVAWDVESGLISRKEGKLRAAAYEHYRNLSGINVPNGSNLTLDSDHSNDPSLNMGRKINGGRGKDKYALGRSDEAQNILARTILGYQASVIRGHKNLMAQKILNFFETNYDPNFISINEHSMKKEIGSDGFSQLVENTGYFGQADVMVAKIKGIPVTMRFKDTGLNSVLESVHGRVVPQELKSQMAHMVGQWTRLTGQLITTYNPFWIPINFVRDVQTLFFNSAADGKIKTGMAIKMMGQLLPFAGTAIRIAIQDFQPSSARGKAAQRNILALIKPNAERMAIYHEARLNGGLTSFIARNDLESQIIEINEAMHGKSLPSKINGVLKFMQLLTIPMEMAPRLAAYSVTRQAGWSARDAAVYAGGATVDFNMRGSNETVRNLYLFFNPAVQGTAQLFSLAKNNPQRFATIAGGLSALGFFVSMMTRLGGGDDDDKKKEDVNTLDKIPTYKRATALVFSPDTRWGAIPIAYGWNAFYAAGVFAADTVYGKTPLSVTLKRITHTAFEAFSPVGGSGFDLTKVASDPGRQAAALVTPTILMPLLQWYTNTNRFGSPITPDSLQGKREGYSDTTKAFGSVNPISKDFAVWLQQSTGGSRANKEGIDINPALMDHLIQAYTPGLASELYKVAGNEVRTARGVTIPREKELLADRFSAYASDSSDAQAFRRVSEKAGGLFEELKITPPSDPRAVQIKKEYPGLALAMNAIQITNKGLDTLRSDAAKVELDAYQYRHAGKIAEADAKDKAVVKFKNEEKAAEKRIYGLATKAFIKAGFEPLVVSGD